MKLYIKIENNEILQIEDEKIEDNFEELEVNNIEEFYKKIEKFEKLDEELDEKLASFFEKTEEGKDTLNQYNIKHWVSNRSFGELIDMYENDEIIKPKMQRKFVWDSLKCSRLIESIIMGLPIPPLFLLEIDKNKYEIIDGFQRLSTVSNYIGGKPWNSDTDSKRKITSKLSSKVSEEIKGKTFKELNPEYQRILKRSTIPLIEFKQLTPDDLTSKYLIFERINTGSEKLSPMQIRKSLSYGKLIESLYKYSEINKDFVNLFSRINRNKDSHIEAFLRIYVMNAIYLKKYILKKEGIKHILDDFCETQKDKEITDEYFKKFEDAFLKCKNFFKEKKNMFKRVEMDNDKYIFVGNINISIMESLITIMMNEKINISFSQLLNSYKKIIADIINKSINGIESNPFSSSTGTIISIEKRFEICKKIIGV